MGNCVPNITPNAGSRMNFPIIKTSAALTKRDSQLSSFHKKIPDFFPIYFHACPLDSPNCNPEPIICDILNGSGITPCFVVTCKTLAAFAGLIPAH